MTPLELQGYSCVLEVCLLTAHPSQAGFLLQKRGLNFILLSITRVLSKQVLFSSTLFSATAWKESINLQIISTAAHHPISMCLFNLKTRSQVPTLSVLEKSLNLSPTSLDSQYKMVVLTTSSAEYFAYVKAKVQPCQGGPGRE